MPTDKDENAHVEGQEEAEEVSLESDRLEEKDEVPSEETSPKEDPQISEEDEWLYSGPRRFAKKPDDEPENR